ncbi:Lhr-like helicase [Thermoplasmatales archaeon BRNA1]|nr:Lhr-like helicase [Thermoplasmatales archaeon BRNA1]
MPFDTLSPVLVEALRSRGITEPTDPQRDAIPRIQKGHNVLVVAPTGIGKTESAMLPVFDDLAQLEDRKGIRCIYVTPLRALNRDMLRRMEDLGAELKVSVGVRHGDTPQSERNRMSRSPPQILITTPETMQIMFIGKNLREGLKNVKYVVIDEIHELAGNERGAQLAVALERLVQLAGEYQRIGLSATVGNLDEVRNFLSGEGREVDVCKHDTFREFDIRVERPLPAEADAELQDKLQSDPDILAVMKRARYLIDSVTSTLFFVNTRETAEWLASRYHMWDEDYPIGVHHGSLSKENRMETEDEFKTQKLKGLICTSSLELGIDIGSADLVIQYNSPRQVARMTQRAGRAGHRIGGRIRSVILATAPDEVAEAMVVARRCEAKEMEYAAGRPNPLNVLANQLVGMAMVGPFEKEEGYRTVIRSHPFRTLSKKDFDDTVEQLKSIWILRENEDGTVGKSRKGMQYFYQNISMIPDEKTYRVRDIGTRAIIGTLDESFVATLEGEAEMFIAKGRTWRVVEMREDELLVEEARTVGNVPSWEGSDIPVPFEVAMEVGHLRRKRDFSRYPADRPSVECVTEYLDLQQERWTVPTDNIVTIETGDRVAIINCCFGSRVNDTLSKILSALLTARVGESLGVTTDAYRIILQLPRNIDRKVIYDTFMSIRPGTVEAISRLTVLNSTHLKWRFMNVAKKFGIIEKGADRRYINYGRLFDIHKDTPAYNDAVNKVLWEDLDIENTELALRLIHDGKISVVMQGASSIGLEGITRTKELMQPARADHAILMAMKKRLDNEILYASCLNCKNQRRLRVGDAPKRLRCPSCDGVMIALLKDYERDLIRDYGKPGRGAEGKKNDMRINKNANLVNSYGGMAAEVLAGRGVGPEVAARILMKMHVDEDELLRDIMASEVLYARTKRFWD